MARKRTAAWTLLGAATLLATLVALWKASDLGRASGSLDRQLAAARREGVPTEYADVRRVIGTTPPEENAAPLYLQAFADLKAEGGLKGVKAGYLILSIPKGEAKPTDVAALREALKGVAPALERAKEASRLPSLDFGRAWERGSSLEFPEFSNVRDVVQTLVLRAIVATDPASAADDLRAAARIRTHFGAEPVLIAALVGDGVEGMVHQGVRFVGRRGGAWTRAVAPVLGDLGAIPALRRSLASEAVFGIHFDEEIAKEGAGAFGGMDGTPVPFTMRLMGLRPVRDAAKARIVEYWRNAWAKLPEDPTDFRAARAALQVPIEKGPSYELLEFLLPVFDNFAAANAQVEANRRLTREALALWSGRTPTPERDPFGTGPLKLRRTGANWTLYSVGPDGKDDGGKRRTPNAGDGYDLVVDSR